LITNGVQLVWNWGANGLLASTMVRAQVKIFAIEMVYVTQGSFYVGDGTTTDVEGQFCSGTNTTKPFQIISEGALTLGGGGASSLGNNNARGMPNDSSVSDDFNDTTSQALPATFPKGYNAFYMMKYDLTQGQYRDFLNTLTRTQQEMHIVTAIDGNIQESMFIRADELR